jgi:hypothetical protein
MNLINSSLFFLLISNFFIINACGPNEDISTEKEVTRPSVANPVPETKQMLNKLNKNKDIAKVSDKLDQEKDKIKEDIEEIIIETPNKEKEEIIIKEPSNDKEEIIIKNPSKDKEELAITEPNKDKEEVVTTEYPEDKDDIKTEEPKELPPDSPELIFARKVDQAIKHVLPYAMKEYGTFDSPIDDIKNSELMKNILTASNSQFLSAIFTYNISDGTSSSGTILWRLAQQIIEQQKKSAKTEWVKYRTKLLLIKNKNAAYIIEEAAKKIRSIIPKDSWTTFLDQAGSDGANVLSELIKTPVGQTNEALFSLGEYLKAFGLK